MLKNDRLLKKRKISQIVNEERPDPQQTKAIWKYLESDLIKLNPDLEAQLAEVKSHNKELLIALEFSEAARKKHIALFENNPGGLFILSKQGTICELNAAAAHLLDREKLQLINHDFDHFVTEGSVPEFKSFIAILCRNHGSSSIEMQLIKSNGSSVPTHIVGTFYRDSKECLLSVSVVDQQKVAKKAYQPAYDKYRMLHESMMDGFVHVDMNGKITECNEIYRSMLGYTEEECKELNYMDITPEHWHQSEATIVNEQVLVRGFSDVYEKEYRKKNGTIFPVELRTILMRDEKGENTGMWAIVRDITQRKKAENNLKANEEKYRKLIEFAPDAFFQGDAQGNLIVVNNRAIELTGYSREELLAMNLADLIPADIIRDKPLRYDLLKLGEVIKTERAIRRKSGELVDIDMNSKGMPDFTYQCFARDITKRKRAEEVIRNSEEHYRELADSITDGFFSMDADLTLTYCNKSFEKNSGKRSEELIGKSLYDVFPDMKGSVREMVYLDVLKTQQPGSCVDEFMIKGEKKYFEIKTYPSKKGLVVFIYDVNHRMQTEKELTLFKSIIESSGASIAVTDPDGKLVYMNPAYEKLFGWSSGEAVGLNFRDHYPVESLNILNGEMMNSLSQGIPWEGELEAYKKNGHMIPIWAHAGSVRDEKGQNVAFFSILEDISGQKKAESDRLQLQKVKGEESERLRIAHDLHNHIGHIIIAIKIHIERAIASATSDKNNEQLEQILDKVIFALKEVRLVSSKLAERFSTPWKLRQQISTFLTDLELTSEIQIVQKIDPLPDEIPSPLMRTMVGILEEALTNVMKHSEANRVYVHIFIKKERLYINIRDNGIGMDDKFIHQGSGLCFLKEEVASIGGEIKIKSVPGKFCMLKFNAPLI